MTAGEKLRTIANQAKIPIVSSYKYLGVEIDGDFRIDRSCEIAISRIRGLRKKLDRILSCCTLNLALNLYVLYALPLILIMPAFCQRDPLNQLKLQTAIKRSLKNWLNLHYSFNNQALFIILGTDTKRILQWCKRFLQKGGLKGEKKDKKRLETMSIVDMAFDE